MSNIFQQLQQRNVIKAAISYVIISWAFLQAADIIFPLLNIDDSVLRVILIALVILFPFWIVFAYFFEWTSQGFRLTSKVAEGASISKTTSRRLNHYIIGGLIIAVVLLITDRFTNFTGTLPESISKERSIAVLPFDNLGDPETAYFAEGMAEDILTQLSKVASLRVLSRVTLAGYDTNGKTAEEIGKELGVNYLLTGSIRKAKDQVRVNCQLVQVYPEEQAWAESFDRQLNDIFRIQSEVAKNITNQLQASLSLEEKQRIEQEPTQSLEAYTLYLKGREAYNKHLSKKMIEAANLFKQAIAIDSNLSLAYAGLADSYGQLAHFEVLPRSLYFDSALYFGNRSIELNPELAEGWKSIGNVLFYQGDLPGARVNFEKALEFNPNYHPAVVNLVPIYGMQGMFTKAMRTAEKGLRLDPLNPFSYGMVADGLKYIGLLDSAETIIKMGIEIAPNVSAQGILSEVYIDQGRFELAKQSLEEFVLLDSASLNIIFYSASIALRFDTALANKFLSRIPDTEEILGKRHFDGHSTIGYLVNEPDSAQKWFDSGIAYYEKAINSGQQPHKFLAELCRLYAMNEQIDEALKVLEKMVEANYIYTAQLRSDPRFKNLWDHPEFLRFINVMEKKNENYRMELSAIAPLR